MPKFGALYICSHCGLKEFYQKNSIAGNPECNGWYTANTPTEKLELCEDCYDDYLGMIRSFKLSTPYRMPNRDKQNQFIIHNKECDTDGSESVAQEQSTLEPADTAADSIARAEAIREAGGNRCQGR